jgi:hypothetical protein
MFKSIDLHNYRLSFLNVRFSFDFILFNCSVECFSPIRQRIVGISVMAFFQWLMIVNRDG